MGVIAFQVITQPRRTFLLFPSMPLLELLPVPLAIQRTAGAIVHTSMCAFKHLETSVPLTCERQGFLVSRFVIIVFAPLRASYASKRCRGLPHTRLVKECRLVVLCCIYGNMVSIFKPPTCLMGLSCYQYSGIYPVIRESLRIKSFRSN